jgi:hypothetical protein
MTHARRSTMPPDAAPPVQRDDVNIRAILGFGAGLIVLAIAIHLMVWLLFQYFNGREAARFPPVYPLAIGEAGRQPPEPRLQTNPRDDLRALRAHEDELLNNYSWVDKPAGIVRIPIEEAMRITAQRGLPARPATREAK